MKIYTDAVGDVDDIEKVCSSKGHLVANMSGPSKTF